jgi:prephenate dehydrogenase
MDVGSTKSDIVKEMEKLPERFDPVGGHPMCGKEKLTLENAEGSLFQDATFTLTPCQNTSTNARHFANQLAQTIGATPFWIDAATHDRWTAATSHFPYLVTAALTLATPVDAAPLVGPGFRSTTRLAATPPSMMLDILSTNRENILESLDLFKEELDQIRTLLENNDQDHLLTLLKRCVERREQITLGESGIEPS